MIHTQRLSLLLFFLATLFAVHPLNAQYNKVSVGFYNTENLFDTIPSPFYNDHEFTPQSRRHWNSERYRCKLGNIARVIDDAGFDVVALAEVENETVVRDLVMTLSDDYSYIHRTSSDRRGIDLALLYKGDKFFPDTVCLINSNTPREFMLVHGNMIGEEMAVMICHLPSKLNDMDFRLAAARRLSAVADSLLTCAGYERLVILGDLNCELDMPPMSTVFPVGTHSCQFVDVLAKYRHHGFGSYCWDNQWILYDNIVVSKSLATGQGLHVAKAGIFIRNYMLTGTGTSVRTDRIQRGYPRRTFYGNRYLGGYSDHLPVFVIFTR